MRVGEKRQFGDRVHQGKQNSADQRSVIQQPQSNRKHARQDRQQEANRQDHDLFLPGRMNVPPAHCHSRMPHSTAEKPA